MEQKTAFHMKVCRIMNSPLLLSTFLIFFMKLLYVAIAMPLTLILQVENESESEMALCGRCHLPTHK